MNDSLLQKLHDYQMPTRAAELIRSTRIVFLVGVTGAGKDTVIHELLKSGDYHRIVSHTTRPLRHNHGVLEQNGVDYHFVDLQTIETMLGDDCFVEAKQFSSNVYGTSVAEIQMAHDEGKIAITEIEVQGVAEYRAISDKVTPIFLLPPDFKTWQQRLSQRHGEAINPEDLAKRMNTAKIELQEALDKDYFEYVVNQDLQETIKIVDAIAHGNFSTKKNAAAKQVAQNLLGKLI